MIAKFIRDTHDLLAVADKAKARLISFLGYVPALETSVFAEVFLREAMLEPKYNFSDRLNTTDLEALTLIKFREVLLTKGLKAALTPLFLRRT
ncbi:hypothetical protein ACFQ3S_17400 [Mucilaginibacter terrae]|uniref:hypothetical protein n=1 Tax=Mucilaginibacter terrae TaxID=1955052 RepID=UPI003625ADEF